MKINWQYWNCNTPPGLYYFGARWYDPLLGRFINADPKKPNIENPMELNPYQYCANNPFKYVDPDGAMYVRVHSDLATNIGQLTLYFQTGVPVANFEVRTLGKGNMPSNIQNGNTPEGVYQIHDTRGGGDNMPAFTREELPNHNPESYGTGFVRLSRVEGEAMDRGADIAIHGGGRSPMIRDPYADNQNWVNTFGCFRMQNGDINSLIHLIDDVRGIENDLGIAPQKDMLFFNRDGNHDYFNNFNWQDERP